MACAQNSFSDFYLGISFTLYTSEIMVKLHNLQQEITLAATHGMI